MLRFLPPLLIATVIAGGLGVASTRLSPTPSRAAKVESSPAQAAAVKPVGDGAKPAEKDAKAAKGPPTVSGVIALPPIVGPLRAPANIWVRFEGIVIVDEMDEARSKELVAEIASDTLVYFSTVTLPEIEGAIGLKAVREDLSERARIRGRGKVRDFLIQTLVTQ